ncbi:DUF6557 family protein [uncultured Cytophaga sp.]|uniref:DUF6557 family protein n=1 Tax=uncultured Cytophaga sp. TaxID=160238 RepID=UPI0026230C17|nr:DUF6557 family protein [uncultured Cytophaga sp.]
MQFIELIKNNNWLNVSETFLASYPDEADVMDEYENIFQQLQEMDAEVCSIQIKLEWFHHEESNTPAYVEVSGIDTLATEQQIECLALEYLAWRKWLGMSIEEKTRADFTAIEIITHCLYEMTFVGYDETEIQAAFLEFNASIDALDALTDEEKLHNTRSLDDLKQGLYEEES